MAIKEVFAFDHLPISGSVTYADVPGAFDRNRGFGTAAVKLITNRKRLVVSGEACLLRMKLHQIDLDTSKKVIIGYRVRLDNVGCIVVGFSQAAIFTTFPVVAITGTMLGAPALTDLYIETVLDYEHGTLSVFVDGAMKYTRGLGGEGTTYPCIGVGNTANTTYGFNITDIYVRDCSGEDDIFPFGMAICTPVVIDSAETSGWTSTSGDTVLGTLSTPFVALSEATPVIESAVSAAAQPIVASLNATTAGSNTIIEAVKLLVSAKDSTVPAKTISGSLQLDGQSTQGKSLLLTTLMQPNKSLGCFSKAPDGSAWTLAKVNQSTVTATTG